MILSVVYGCMTLILSLVLALFTCHAVLPPPLLQEKVQTPIGEADLVVVLRETHVEVFGKLPSRGRLAVAWGQVALENGHGTAVFNHNFGNVGAYRGYPYYKHGGSQFRSYPTFEDGARVYWELLRDRCSRALASFDQMDGTLTATLLRRCGYHRTDVERYARILRSLLWYGYRLQR